MSINDVNRAAASGRSVYMLSSAVAGAEPTTSAVLAQAGPGWAAQSALSGWSPGTDAEELPAGSILVCGPCDSSMDVAWALIEAGELAPWSSVLAVSQSGGRGRMGRRWVSPPGNVYGAWHWPAGDPDLGDLTPLAAGVLVAQALDGPVASENGESHRLGIKWPNDLVFADYKVGGILVEQRGRARVVGIGLNINPAIALAPRVERDVLPAGTLPLPADQTDPLSVWRCVTAVAPDSLDSEAVKSLAEERLIWLGERVCVEDGSEGSVGGKLLGLTQSGALHLATAGGEQILNSGTLIPDNSSE